MSKLDYLNRLYVPKRLLENTNIDFKRPIYLFMRSEKCFYIDNASHINRYTTRLHKEKITKERRYIYFPSSMRKQFKINSNTEFVLYISNRTLHIMKYVVPKKFH